MQLTNSESKEFVIHKVLNAPNLACNLFPVRAAATSKGKSVKCLITNAGLTIELVIYICGMGSLVDKLYHLDCELVSSESVSVALDEKLWD